LRNFSTFYSELNSKLSNLLSKGRHINSVIYHDRWMAAAWMHSSFPRSFTRSAGRLWYLKRGVWLYTICHLPLPFAICDSESVTAVNYSRLLPLSGAQEMSKNNPMINRKSLSSRRVGWGSVSDSDSDSDWDPRGPY